MRLSVLGITALHSDDGAARLLTPTERRLLSLFAIDRRHVWSADELAEALFGVHAGSARAKTVRNRISELRERHGSRLVVTVGSGYRLGNEPTIDADEFVAVAGRPDLPSESLSLALALWRGRAFEDIEDWPDTAAAAARLDLCRMHVEEHAVAVELEEGGSPVAAAATLEALVGSQPFRERRWGLLMRAYAMSGQRREAAAAYRRAYETLAEVGLSPGEELRRLESAILAGRDDLGPIPSTRSGGLPFPVGSLVGRTEETRVVLGLLESTRIVTVIGFGGLGKTRLANHVAHEWCQGNRQPGSMIDLAAARSDDDAFRLAASALGLAIRGSARDILAAWRPDTVQLVVLDNCESFLGAARAIATTLVSASPSLLLLATSRVPLDVPGETTVVLRPLSPVDGAFLLRRHASRELDSDTAMSLSVLLEHVPLALQLGGAALDTASPGELQLMLRSNVRSIDDPHTYAAPDGEPGGGRTGLAAMIEWSIDHLHEATRTALFDLASVVTSFTLGALRTVAGLAGDTALAFSVARGLVRSSLVQVQPGQPTRYRILDTTRKIAIERVSAEQHGIAERRFAEWAGDFVQATEIDDVLRLVPEIANLLAAGTLACDRGWVDEALRIADAARPLQMAEHFELVDLETRAVGLPGAESHPLFEKVCTMAAEDNFWARSRTDVALALIDRVAALSPQPRAWVEHLRGFAAGDMPRILAALPLAVEAGDDLAVLAILAIRAATSTNSDQAAAIAAADTATRIADRSGTAWTREMALMTRACAYSGFDTTMALAALSELEALATTTGLTQSLHAARGVLAGSLRDDDSASRLRLGIQGMRTASDAAANHWFAISCLGVATTVLRLGNRHAAAILSGGLRRFTASWLAGLENGAGLGEVDLADEHEAFVAGSRLTTTELVAVAEEAAQMVNPDSPHSLSR